MGSRAYNGWAGEIREDRGNLFYKLLDKKEIPPPTHCLFCGSTHGKDGWNTYHAEEYGSTWEDYVGACIPVCPTCHGMIHMRFRFPNRFKRLKQRVAEGVLFSAAPRFKNLKEFFTAAGKLKDISFHPDVESGIDILDGISLTKYSGPPKIATLIDKNGSEIPHPKFHDMDLLGLTGAVVRPFKTIEVWTWTPQ